MDPPLIRLSYVLLFDRMPFKVLVCLLAGLGPSLDFCVGWLGVSLVFCLLFRAMAAWNATRGHWSGIRLALAGTAPGCLPSRAAFAVGRKWYLAVCVWVSWGAGGFCFSIFDFILKPML